MKKIIEVNRQLAGVEDFLWGDGTVTQIRGGKEVEVTRINAMEIPYGNITIGEAIAGGIQGLGIFTTSSSLVDSGSVSIDRSTVSVPANKVIQVDDLILDAFSLLGKVTTLEDDTITVEFYATVIVVSSKVVTLPNIENASSIKSSTCITLLAGTLTVDLSILTLPLSTKLEEVVKIPKP
jgi:hypothetical protein